LDKDGGNVKALYRRAQGHLAVGDFVEAEVDLRRAMLEEPANKDVRALFKRYKEQVGPSANLNMRWSVLAPFKICRAERFCNACEDAVPFPLLCSVLVAQEGLTMVRRDLRFGVLIRHVG
jgi:hypothetical protein